MSAPDDVSVWHTVDGIFGAILARFGSSRPQFGPTPLVPEPLLPELPLLPLELPLLPEPLLPLLLAPELPLLPEPLPLLLAPELPPLLEPLLRAPELPDPELPEPLALPPELPLLLEPRLEFPPEPVLIPEPLLLPEDDEVEKPPPLLSPEEPHPDAPPSATMIPTMPTPRTGRLRLTMHQRYRMPGKGVKWPDHFGFAEVQPRWKLGNSLEVPDGETGWGNPKATQVLPTPSSFTDHTRW
jgi:hypothetical protein